MRRLFCVTLIFVPLSAFLAFGVAGCGPSENSGAKSVIEVNADVESLVPNPPTRPTIFAKAQNVRRAIRKGDFSKAEKLMREVLSQSHVGRWHYAPFSEFMNYVAAPANKEFSDKLNEWVKVDPKLSLSRLVRADYHYNRGWWIRGDDFAGNIQVDHLKRFRNELELARTDVEAVIRSAPDNPFARRLRLLIARDIGGQEGVQAAFEKSIARLPNYYALYAVQLGSLRPRWGGSIGAMKSFVTKYADATPNSPRKLLHLQLYADLLGAASLRCDDYKDRSRQQCVGVAMERIAGEQEARAAHDAIGELAKPGEVDANNEIRDILSSIIRTPGAEDAALALVQFDATALDSDAQLVIDPDKKNDYTIDQLASLIWYVRGNYDNALKLSERAVKDMAHTDFASTAQADAVRADIYHGFAASYNRLRNWRQTARYGAAAARLLGGFGSSPGDDHVVCAALVRLKQYKQALKVCTAIVRASGDWQARLFRAEAYEATRQYGKALADYRAVAGSEVMMSMRTYAAIEVSVVYDKEGKVRNALDALDGFSDLFIKGRVTDSSLAVYYNNRCYSKMKLRRFEAALKDCDTSLQYGNIPDALSKQRKLTLLLEKAKAASAGSR